MQKRFREKRHFVAVAGQNHYLKDDLLFEVVYVIPISSPVLITDGK